MTGVGNVFFPVCQFSKIQCQNKRLRADKKLRYIITPEDNKICFDSLHYLELLV